MGRVERMGSLTLRLRRLAVYLVFTMLLMPVQAIGLLLHQRWVTSFPRFYHRCCCRILGLRVRRIGEPVTARPVLFAANHVSYLDITIFGSLIAGSFIAKREVARWPLFGWLAKLQRSVFIDRQIRSTAEQRDSIAGRLAAREALILFPEGTSGDGNRVLPFKSALFSVADQAASGPVTVQPVSIAYTRLDGMPIGRRFRPLFAWYGAMAMAPHLWRVLGLGTIEVVVEFHPPTTLAACGSRKTLARYCEARVAPAAAPALG
jgi:1-acyl-sn-glycerol-3-phosphate acyltransferase